MPPLLGIIPAVLGSVGAIEGLAGGGSQTPPTPTPTPTPTPSGPTPAQLASQKAMIGQQVPGVVGATSGFTSPSYDSIIAQILAGAYGQPGANAAGNASVGQQFAPVNNAPTAATVANQPVNLADFINNFSGAT